jgi:hypothetical protein
MTPQSPVTCKRIAPGWPGYISAFPQSSATASVKRVRAIHLQPHSYSVEWLRALLCGADALTGSFTYDGAA